MNRVVIAALAAAAVVGVSGGVAVALNEGDSGTPTAHDTTTSTPPAASTSTPPASPPTSTPPSTTGTAASSVFGPVSYAGIQLGTTAADARAVGARVGNPHGETCQLMHLPNAQGRTGTTEGWVSPNVGVAYVTTTDPAAATPEGMHVGSTPAQVRAIYPNAKEAPDFWYVAVPGHPGTSYWWGYKNGKVGALTLVLDDQDCVN